MLLLKTSQIGARPLTWQPFSSSEVRSPVAMGRCASLQKVNDGKNAAAGI
jgi:hypothetical protein